MNNNVDHTRVVSLVETTSRIMFSNLYSIIYSKIYELKLS